ncbi:MAG: sulfite exporter TauE/SafE family protein [Deltaproteobacteria bacterium]|nr:MAG: sulfite exporter TauE/SafE family protein [Deltaproteobacteria bacterium]
MLLAGVAVFAGAFIQGMSGFGFGMVTMALLPLFMDVADAVPLVAGVGITVSLNMAWRLRRQLELRRALPLIGGGLVGTPVGIAFLQGANPRLVKAVLGVVILGYSAWALLHRDRETPERPPSLPLGAAAGFLGGLLGGAFNTGGPPAILYVTAMGWRKHAATSTLQVFFLMSGCFTVTGHLLVGNFDAPVRALLLPTLAAAWLGIGLGSRIYHRIPPHRFQRVVLGMLAVLGANFLVRSVLAS